MKKLLALLLVILGGLAAAPAIIGFQVETSYQEMLLRLQELGLKPEQQSYHRGWFSSSADTLLALDSGGAEASQRLRLRSEIRHGPVSAAGDLMLASMVSRLHPADTPEADSLRLDTRFGFDGRGVTQVAASAWEQAAAEKQPGIWLGGADGRLEYELTGEQASGAFSLPFLELQTLPGDRLRLETIRWNFSRTALSHGIPLGEGRFEAASMTLPANAMRPLALDMRGLEAEFSNQEAEGALQIRVAYRIDALDLDQKRWGPAGLVIRLDGLPAKAIGRIQRQAQAGQVNALGELGALLANGLEFSLRDLSLQTPEGELQGELRLSVPKLDDALRANPLMILAQIQGEAFLRLPEALYFSLTAQAGDAPEQDPASRLQAMLDQQYLVRDGDFLQARVRLQNGMLEINDKPISLPFGGGMMPGNP